MTLYQITLLLAALLVGVFVILVQSRLYGMHRELMATVREIRTWCYHVTYVSIGGDRHPVHHFLGRRIRHLGRSI